MTLEDAVENFRMVLQSVNNLANVSESTNSPTVCAYRLGEIYSMTKSALAAMEREV